MSESVKEPERCKSTAQAMTDASSAEEEGIPKIAAIAQAKERIDAHLRQEAKPRPELSSEVISRSTLSWANKQFALLPSSRRLFKAVKATTQECVNLPPFIPTLAPLIPFGASTVQIALGTIRSMIWSMTVPAACRAP